MNLLLSFLAPYAKTIALVVAAMLAVGGLYLYVKHEGRAQALQEQAQKDIAAFRSAVEKAQASSEDLEQKLVKAQKVNEQLNERLANENSVPAYHECSIPASGLRLLNDTRAARSAK